jgi:hypothetical protein
MFYTDMHARYHHTLVQAVDIVQEILNYVSLHRAATELVSQIICLSSVNDQTQMVSWAYLDRDQAAVPWPTSLVIQVGIGIPTIY